MVNWVGGERATTQYMRAQPFRQARSAPRTRHTPFYSPSSASLSRSPLPPSPSVVALVARSHVPPPPVHYPPPPAQYEYEEREEREPPPDRYHYDDRERVDDRRLYREPSPEPQSPPRHRRRHHQPLRRPRLPSFSPPRHASPPYVPETTAPNASHRRAPSPPATDVWRERSEGWLPAPAPRGRPRARALHTQPREQRVLPTRRSPDQRRPRHPPLPPVHSPPPTDYENRPRHHRRRRDRSPNAPLPQQHHRRQPESLSPFSQSRSRSPSPPRGPAPPRGYRYEEEYDRRQMQEADDRRVIAYHHPPSLHYAPPQYVVEPPYQSAPLTRPLRHPAPPPQTLAPLRPLPPLSAALPPPPPTQFRVQPAPHALIQPPAYPRPPTAAWTRAPGPAPTTGGLRGRVAGAARPPLPPAKPPLPPMGHGAPLPRPVSHTPSPMSDPPAMLRSLPQPLRPARPVAGLLGPGVGEAAEMKGDGVGEGGEAAGGAQKRMQISVLSTPPPLAPNSASMVGAREPSSPHHSHTVVDGWNTSRYINDILARTQQLPTYTRGDQERKEKGEEEKAEPAAATAAGRLLAPLLVPSAVQAGSPPSAVARRGLRSQLPATTPAGRRPLLHPKKHSQEEVKTAAPATQPRLPPAEVETADVDEEKRAASPAPSSPTAAHRPSPAPIAATATLGNDGGEDDTAAASAGDHSSSGGGGTVSPTRVRYRAAAQPSLVFTTTPDYERQEDTSAAMADVGGRTSVPTPVTPPRVFIARSGPVNAYVAALTTNGCVIVSSVEECMLCFALDDATVEDVGMSREEAGGRTLYSIRYLDDYLSGKGNGAAIDEYRMQWPTA